MGLRESCKRLPYVPVGRELNIKISNGLFAQSKLSLLAKSDGVRRAAPKAGYIGELRAERAGEPGNFHVNRGRPSGLREGFVRPL